MSDVIDEDLMKELGLDEDDLKEIEDKKTKRNEASATAAQSLGNEPSQASAPAPSLDEEPSLSASLTGDDLSDDLDLDDEAPTKVASPSPAAPSRPVPQPEPDDLSRSNENLARDVPVQLAAVMDKKTLSLGQILEMRVGEVIDFNKGPSDTIDLVANGKLVAKAELVMVDGKLGVRIIKLIR